MEFVIVKLFFMTCLNSIALFVFLSIQKKMETKLATYLPTHTVYLDTFFIYRKYYISRKPNDGNKNTKQNQKKCNQTKTVENYWIR